MPPSTTITDPVMSHPASEASSSSVPERPIFEIEGIGQASALSAKLSIKRSGGVQKR